MPCAEAARSRRRSDKSLSNAALSQSPGSHHGGIVATTPRQPQEPPHTNASLDSRAQQVANGSPLLNTPTSAAK